MQRHGHCGFPPRPRGADLAGMTPSRRVIRAARICFGNCPSGHDRGKLNPVFNGLASPARPFFYGPRGCVPTPHRRCLSTARGHSTRGADTTRRDAINPVVHLPCGHPRKGLRLGAQLPYGFPPSPGCQLRLRSGIRGGPVDPGAPDAGHEPVVPRSETSPKSVKYPTVYVWYFILTYLTIQLR